MCARIATIFVRFVERSLQLPGYRIGGVMFRVHRLSVAVLGVVLATAALSARQPEVRLPLRLTGLAIGTGGVYTRPVASQVDITISRWSTEAETARLITTLKEKGPEALLDAVQDAKPVGTIRTPGNLAYDLRFAQQEMLGDGIRRVVLMTDRPISMWEAVNRPRSIDYPFTLIELRLDKNNEGQGKLNLATRIDVSRTGKMIQLENYDAQPIHLNEVRPADR